VETVPTLKEVAVGLGEEVVDFRALPL